MFDSTFFQSLVQSTSNLTRTKITVYLDGNLLVNDDGNPSFCKVLTVDERNGLALDENIQITSILYSVVYSSVNPPETSLSFTISEGEGEVTQRKKVNFLRYVPKEGHYEILLLGN